LEEAKEKLEDIRLHLGEL